MLDKPLLSVMVPCYNEEGSLPNFLDSMLSQSYTNVEIVIFDNASSDGSSEIIRDFCARDQRAKHILFDHHVSRNIQGLRTRYYHCKGDLLSFRSVNDFVHKDYFSDCVDLIMDDSRVALAYSHGELIDLNETRRIACHPLTKIDTRNLGTVESGLHVMNYYTHSFALWGVYRRSKFVKTQTSYHYGADHVLICEMALHGAIAPIERSLHTISIDTTESSLVGIERMWHSHHPLLERGVSISSPFMTLDAWIPFTSMIIGHQKMIAGAHIDDRYKVPLLKGAKNILGRRFDPFITFEHDRLFSILGQSDLRGIGLVNEQFSVDLINTMAQVRMIVPERADTCNRFIELAMTL